MAVDRRATQATDTNAGTPAALRLDDIEACEHGIDAEMAEVHYSSGGGSKNYVESNNNDKSSKSEDSNVPSEHIAEHITEHIVNKTQPDLNTSRTHDWSDTSHRQDEMTKRKRAYASQIQAEALEKLIHSLEFLRSEHVRISKQAAVIQLALEAGTVHQDTELVMNLKMEMEDHAQWVNRGILGFGQSLNPPKRLHTAHTRSLLDVAQAREMTFTHLQQITQQIEDTTSEASTVQVQGKIQEIINSKCTPSTYMLSQLEDSQATPDDTGIRDDVIYARLDTDRSEEAEDMEPLFPVSESSRKYQATAADLTLQSPDGTRIIAKGSVIDSGAARCAIDFAHLKRWFPNIAIRPTGRSFHDASGNRMNIVGEVDLAFLLGDLVLWTTVYVFRGLGHHFLLGVNAIHEHGLTISSVRSVLFSERPEATSASEIPLTMANCSICDSTEPPHAMTATLEKSQHDATLTPEIPCDCPKIDLIYSVPERCLKVKRHRNLNDGASKPTSLPCYGITPTDVRTQAPDSREQRTEVRINHRVTLGPGETAIIPLEYGTLCEGEETTAEVEVSELFAAEYPMIRIAQLSYHSTLTRHANLRVKNMSESHVKLKANTLVATATYHARRPKARQPRTSGMIAEITESNAPLVHSFRVLKEDRASGLAWKCLGVEPPGDNVAFADGSYKLSRYRVLPCAILAEILPRQTSFSPEEWKELAVTPQLLLTHCVQATNGLYYAPTEALEFADGGRPRTREDLHHIGFSLEKAIDPSKPKQQDGNYPPLDEERKTELYAVALEFWYVWSRDARAPELSRLVVIEIPTGDANPIAQKPYPIPYAYLEAARDELQKLVDAGLLEPCISNWASPVLVRLKKDSTPDKIRLKLICDFRRLNEVTVPDAAGLGDQDEILDGFGGDQRWAGIVDAAGGFYQLLIHPKDRAKTAICLPTSMGGTQFMWRVAPVFFSLKV